MLSHKPGVAHNQQTGRNRITLLHRKLGPF
jgi:hypothetical protein